MMTDSCACRSAIQAADGDGRLFPQMIFSKKVLHVSEIILIFAVLYIFLKEGDSVADSMMPLAFILSTSFAI